MSYKLTSSQFAAFDAFKTFLSDPTQVLILKGAAGTGKTTMIAEFLKILSASKRPVTLMAPTGRAAYIIGNKCNFSASTIHRAIYVLTNLKYVTRNIEEDLDDAIHARFGLRKNNDCIDHVYIVDEASMISDTFSEGEAFSFCSGKLLTDLFSFAGGRKIVFVGDYAQLPPVGMNFSPALDGEYLKERFLCNVSICMLREVLRQSEGSVMLNNATKVRDSIEKKSFVDFKLDDGCDVVVANEDLLSPYFALFQDKPSVRSVVVTYSNCQALKYNSFIRQRYYGNAVPRLRAGDLLMITRNNYAYEYELFNGNIVLVESCQPDAEVEVRPIQIKTGKNCIQMVELRFRKVVIKFNAGGKSVSLPIILLDNFLDDPSGTLGSLLARALIVDFNKRLPKHINSRLSEIKKIMREKSNLSPEDQMLCEQYLDILNKDPYYNAVICKYGYAITCHKAQGGEWDNVFVDMDRFGGMANESYFRWAYTAITRASKKIWLYNSPDFSYISSLVIEPIQSSVNIKVSTYSGDIDDFREARFLRVKTLAEKMGYVVTQDKSRNFQHWITFSNGASEHATFCLWYNKFGYSNKNTIQESTSSEFSDFCQNIIDSSYAPGDIPYINTARPFAEKLVEFVKSQIEELGIQLLDITQEQNQDVFHLKTDGIAKISFFYTEKGKYTYMRLLSSLGSEDTKLEALRQRFM